MMDWTDVYFRQLVRLLSTYTWLYTEMVVVSDEARCRALSLVTPSLGWCALPGKPRMHDDSVPCTPASGMLQ